MKIVVSWLVGVKKAQQRLLSRGSWWRGSSASGPENFSSMTDLLNTQSTTCCLLQTQYLYIFKFPNIYMGNNFLHELVLCNLGKNNSCNIIYNTYIYIIIVFSRWARCKWHGLKWSNEDAWYIVHIVLSNSRTVLLYQTYTRK